MTIPNLITIVRLLMAPLAVVMIGAGYWAGAFAVFLFAGVSDAVDGFIARRFGMQSQLGAYLDPLADKALLVSIYVALAIHGVLPAWVAIVVVSRDIMIVSAMVLSMLLDRPMEVRPLIVSKLNTGTQIGFAALLLAANAFGGVPEGLLQLALVATVGLTLCSAAAYLVLWLRHMAA